MIKASKGSYILPRYRILKSGLNKKIITSLSTIVHNQLEKQRPIVVLVSGNILARPVAL
jgi:hypothetical protein